MNKASDLLKFFVAYTSTANGEIEIVQSDLLQIVLEEILTKIFEGRQSFLATFFIFFEF